MDFFSRICLSPFPERGIGDISISLRVTGVVENVLFFQPSLFNVYRSICCWKCYVHFQKLKIWRKEMKIVIVHDLEFDYLLICVKV